MPLSVVLAIVATYAVAQSLPAEPVAAPLFRTLGMLVGCGAAPTLAAIGAALARRAVTHPLPAARLCAWRWQRRLRQVHGAAIVGGTLAASALARWPQVVRCNWHADDYPLADDALLLLPIVASLLASWWWQFEAERALIVVASADPQRNGPTRRHEYLAARAREQLLLPVLPVVLLVAVQDAWQWCWPERAQSGGANLISLVALVGIAALFPWLLRQAWRARPLPPCALRTRLAGLADREGWAPREILVWPTGGRLANAAVSGLVPPWRYVFLTDALVERLSEDEVAAVFCHELAHVRRRHLPLRLAVMLLPAALWLACLELWPARIAPVGWFVPLAALAAYLAIAAAGVSRLLELDADAWACRSIDGGGELNPAGVARFAATLEKLAQINGGGRGRSWLHPSLARRAAFLAEVAAQPARLRHFHGRLRWLAALCWTGWLAVGGLLLAAWSLGAA